MANKLTTKQEKFIQELIKGKTQREAYKIAYPKSLNWKEKSIDEAACRTLKISKVLARYNKLKQRLIQESEDSCILEAKDIIRELKNIAFDDISNYLDFKTVKTVIAYDDDGEPIIDYKIQIDIKDSKGIDTKNIYEVSLAANGAFRFKMYDRAAALYKLAEIFGLNELQKQKQKLAEDRFEHDKDIDGRKFW